MSTLTQLQCEPCRGDVPRLTDQEIAKLHGQLPQWRVVELQGIKRLERTFGFKDFREALDFTNRVGDLAEQQGHHPLIVTQWGEVTVTWWTHAIKGLQRNDFIMAAKTDELYEHPAETTTPHHM
jgi:4a-hydroxytetrahydrobiopterin dehydratase